MMMMMMTVTPHPN